MRECDMIEANGHAVRETGLLRWVENSYLLVGIHGAVSERREGRRTEAQLSTRRSVSWPRGHLPRDDTVQYTPRFS